MHYKNKTIYSIILLYKKRGDILKNDNYYKLLYEYETMRNDTNITIRVPKKLRDDFNEKVGKNQANKALRKFMIDCIFDKNRDDQMTTNNSNDLYNLANEYNFLENNATLAIRLPRKLLDDFNSCVSNRQKNKIVRQLLIEYIYNNSFKKQRRLDEKLR